MAQSPAVRPTKRCLDDLKVTPPDLGQALHKVDNPVLAASQQVPARRAAGSAERILSLSDRVWFKVKTGRHRGAVTELSGRELPAEVPERIASWWVGAAGHRQDDSAQHDFYASIAKECTTGKTVSSGHLCPTTWDWKRLSAEQAQAWRGVMKRTVIRIIAMSLRSGQVVEAQFKHHRIKALVRADEGEAYLAIIAEGVPDVEVYAVLLDCVPGVPSDDWQLEPSTVAGIEPASGEIIWSTLLTAEVANVILEMDDTYEE